MLAAPLEVHIGMTASPLAIQVLRLLRERDEQQSGPIPELHQLVEATGKSPLAVTRAGEFLEARGLIRLLR